MPEQIRERERGNNTVEIYELDLGEQKQRRKQAGLSEELPGQRAGSGVLRKGPEDERPEQGEHPKNRPGGSGSS